MAIVSEAPLEGDIYEIVSYYRSLSIIKILLAHYTAFFCLDYSTYIHNIFLELCGTVYFSLPYTTTHTQRPG